MNKKFWFIISTGLIITCLIICLLIPPFIWVWPGLLPQKIRNPEVPTCNLIINIPQKWQDLWKPDYPKEPVVGNLSWGMENCHIGYEPVTFQAFLNHAVYRFRNETEAYFSLKRMQKDPLYSMFIPDKSESDGYIIYTSPIADEYYLRCSNKDGPRCSVFARYDEYVSIFYMTVPPETHTFSEIREFLVSIDEVFVENLR